MLGRFLVRMIRRYQRKGGGESVFMVDCNFEPTCSEFAVQAIERFGAVRGGVMAARRISRCTDRDCVTRKHDPVPAMQEGGVDGKHLS